VHAAGAYFRAADAYRLAGRASEADRADQLAQALGGTLDADVLWHVHAQAASRPALTQREQEITALAAVGASNHTIASRLSVSVRTVENHLNRAFRKLGISRRDELESVRALWSSHPDS
jgi:DNA-binding NarL/FixJ family response regulator